MAGNCGYCGEVAYLLQLGGNHPHPGLCFQCCSQVISLRVPNCPVCSVPFTAIELSYIGSAVSQAAQPASSVYPPPPVVIPRPYPTEVNSAMYQPSSPYSAGQYTYQHSNSSPAAYVLPSQPSHSSPVTSPAAQRQSTGPCFKCSGVPGEDVRLGCGHMACRPHLKEYLTAQSKIKKDIKCPHSDCSYICPAHTIMLIIDKGDFQDYRRTYLKNIMVVCPRPDCRVIEQIGEKHRIVDCSNCRNAYCSRCEKSKTECRCEVPKELICQTCYMIMRPDRHKLMVCENCRATMCTYCSQSGRDCTCNHNALTAITRIDDIAACEVCGEYMRVSELQNVFAMEDCTHVYHKECIEGYVTATLESGQFSSRLTCPKKGCMGIVGNFQKLVTQEQWSLYERKVIEGLFKLVQCPNDDCQEGYTVDGDVKSMTCTTCKQSFCLSCKEPPHEGNCSRAGILAKIRLLEATGEPVSQCPKCKLPYIKDEHCEHVKCMNPDCRVEFCFTCSCLRVPTVKHCNAWHRPNCKWYEGVGADTEKFRKDCPECVTLGRRCDPPKKLRVPCRFDEDEA